MPIIILQIFDRQNCFNAVGPLYILLVFFSYNVFSSSQTNCFTLGLDMKYALNGHCPCHSISAFTRSSAGHIVQVNFSDSDGKNDAISTDNCHQPFFIDSEPASVIVQFKKFKTLNLSRNAFTHFPDFLPEKLTRLDLSGNRLESIEARHLLFVDHLEDLYLDDNFILSVSNRTNVGGKFWQNIHLSSLKKLSLQRNKINSVSCHAFRHLTQLTMLSLSSNKISLLQLETFSGLNHLMDLDLSGNILVQIEDNTFHQLSSLAYLSMKDNQLISLPRGLPMLEWLDISFNSLCNISEDFKPVIHAIEFTNFAHNPLRCDCGLLWLKEMYDRREHIIQYLSINSSEVIPTCHSPEHLANESWDVLSDDVFVCNLSFEKELPPEPNPGRNGVAKEFAVKGEVLNESSVAIVWKFKDPVFSSGRIVIFYYVFGLKSTTLRSIKVAVTESQYILTGLSSQSNYMICINLNNVKSDSDDKVESSPVRLDHCLELTTKSHQLPIEATYFTIYWWYVLTMVTTFFTVVGFITGLALLCSLFNRRHSSNPKSTYPVDEPLSQQDFQAQEFKTFNSFSL